MESNYTLNKSSMITVLAHQYLEIYATISVNNVQGHLPTIVIHVLKIEYLIQN